MSEKDVLNMSASSSLTLTSSVMISYIIYTVSDMPSRDNLIYEGYMQIFRKNNTYTMLYARNLIWYLGEEGTPGANPAPDTEGGTQATVIFRLLSKLVG